jgi:YbbR domain-containing protein
VQVRLAGAAANGYVISGYTVSPGKLEIEGPASHVAQISAAVTDPVDVASLKPTGTADTEQVRVNAFVTDSYVRFEKSPEVVVTLTIKKQARP